MIDLVGQPDIVRDNGRNESWVLLGGLGLIGWLWSLEDRGVSVQSVRVIAAGPYWPYRVDTFTRAAEQTPS